MTSDSSDLQAQLDAEFRRLNLDSSPPDGRWLIIPPDGMVRLLAHLRTLQPGATWREILPDLPRRSPVTASRPPHARPMKPELGQRDDTIPQMQFSTRLDPEATTKLFYDYRKSGLPYSDILTFERTEQEFRGCLRLPFNTKLEVLQQVVAWFKARDSTITVFAFYGPTDGAA